MPVIPSNTRVSLGYEGRLYIEGKSWHQSTTNIDITANLTTTSVRPVGKSRNNMIHLAETSEVSIDGFQLDKNTDSIEVEKNWTTPHYEQVILWGEVGMNIGHRVSFLPVIGRRRSIADDRDALQTVTLTGVQSGIPLFHVPLESSVIRSGLDAFTTTFAASSSSGDGLTSHSLSSATGATEHFFVLFNSGASGAIPSDAEYVGLIAGLTGIGGFQTFSPTLSRWRAGLVHNVNSNAIKPLTPWQPLGLTPQFVVCVASVAHRVTNEFYGFQVELVPNAGETAPTRYNIDVRGSLSYAHI